MNQFQLTLRKINKHRGFSGLNIFGLSVGFAAYILISLFVQYEYSWDTQNENYNRIYRVQRLFSSEKNVVDGNNISPHTRGRTAKLITEKCAEVEKTMVLKEIPQGLFFSTNNKQLIYDNNGYLVDNSVFEIFTYHFVEGSPENALRDPFTIVLSKSFAQKLFPHGNAYGKTIIAEKKFNVKVTGIFEDLPQNSIIRPSYLISMASIEYQENVHNNLDGAYMTYVLLRKNSDAHSVNKKIYDLFKGYDKVTESEKIHLCPLSKVFLNFNDENDYIRILFLYSLTGILILILSAINYINLSTANSTTRAKELAIKKISGSKNSTVVLQLMAESAIFSLISLIIALTIDELLINSFNAVFDKNLVLLTQNNLPFIFKTTLITLAIGFISGIYPALYMNKIKLTELLKGNVFKHRKEFFSVRKVLVTFQFASTLFLLIISLYVTYEIRYILNKDLGFKRENLVYTRFTSSNKNVLYDDLRARILSHPEITSMSLSKRFPFVDFGGGTYDWEGCKPGELINIRDNQVSMDYFDNLKILIKEGRNFSKEYPSDLKNKCLINEKAAIIFNWKNPIGKHINNNRWEIIGVVKDFHFKDMHNTLDPAIFLLNDGIIEGDWILAFRVNPNKYAQALSLISAELEKTFPTDPFQLQNMDDTFKNDYIIKTYKNINRTLYFFTFINLLLAIIGLFGLIAFITQRKTKEIGIRKIHGSSSLSIFLMLNKELITLSLIAAIIAGICVKIIFRYFPGTYKIPMYGWIFLMALGILLAVIIILSAYKTLKTAYTNPVETLRYE